MNKFIAKILLSPIIFIYGILILIIGSIFPFPIIVIFHFIGLITLPFYFILKLLKINVTEIPPLFETKYIVVNYLLGITIYLWFPFLLTYKFIKNNNYGNE